MGPLAPEAYFTSEPLGRVTNLSWLAWDFLHFKYPKSCILRRPQCWENWGSWLPSHAGCSLCPSPSSSVCLCLFCLCCSNHGNLSSCHSPSWAGPRDLHPEATYPRRRRHAVPISQISKQPSPLPAVGLSGLLKRSLEVAPACLQPGAPTRSCISVSSSVKNSKPGARSPSP